MAKIDSIHRVNVQQDVKSLETVVGKNCRVWSCQLQLHGFLRSTDSETSEELYYLKAEFEIGDSQKSFAMLVSPYDLLCFAHQILDELDPGRQRKT